MRTCFNACMMAFSMFCAIPCPYNKWDEDARPLMTLFLPLVGAFIGLLWSLAAFIMQYFQIPPLIAGALLTAYPYLVTGFMHMDGYMDVTDAVKSWRDLDERRRILKDPTCGSFAVVACVLVIMTEFALFSSAKASTNVFTLTLIATVSRTIAALCVTILRPMSTSEYAGAYRKGIKKSHVVGLSIFLAILISLGFVLLGRYGFAAVAVVAGYLLALRRAFKSLDGMSGDISGYALVFGELCGVAVFALI